MLTLLATLKVKPGKEVEVTEIKEKDCLMYIPHVVKNGPTEKVFFEKYKNKEAFKAHGSSAYFQEAARIQYRMVSFTNLEGDNHMDVVLIYRNVIIGY